MSLSSNLTNGEVAPTGGGGFNPAPKDKQETKTPSFNPAPKNKIEPTNVTPPVKTVTPPVTPSVKTVTPPVTPSVKTVTPPVTPPVKTVTPPVTPPSNGFDFLNIFQQQKDLAIAKHQDDPKVKQFYQNPDQYNQNLEQQKKESDLKASQTYGVAPFVGTAPVIQSGQSIQVDENYEQNEAQLKDAPFKPYELSVNDKKSKTNSGSSSKYLEAKGIPVNNDYKTEDLDVVLPVNSDSLQSKYSQSENELKQQVSNSGMLKNFRDRDELYKKTLDIKKKIDDKDAVFNGSEQYIALKSLDKSVKDLQSKIKEVSESDEFKSLEKSVPLISDVNLKFKKSQEFVDNTLKPISDKVTDFVSSKGIQKKDENGNIVTYFSNDSDFAEYNKIKSEYDLIYNQYKVQEQEISSITSSDLYKSYFSDKGQSILSSYDNLQKSYNEEFDKYKKSFESFNSLLTSDKDYQDAKKTLNENISNLDALAKYTPDENDLIAKIVKLHPDALDKPEKFNEYLNNEIQSTLNNKRYNVLREDNFVGELPKDAEPQILSLITSNLYINSPTTRKKALLASFYEYHPDLYKNVSIDNFLQKYSSTITPSAELKIIKSSAKDQENKINSFLYPALEHAKTLESYFVNRGGVQKKISDTEVGASYTRLNTAAKILSEFKNLDYERYETYRDGIRKIGHGLSQTSLIDWIPFAHSVSSLSENQLISQSIKNVDLKKNEYKTKGGEKKLGISEQDYVLRNTNQGEYEIYKAMSTLNSFNTMTSQGLGYDLGKSVFPNLVTFMGEMYTMGSFSLSGVLDAAVPQSLERYLTLATFAEGNTEILASEAIPSLIKSGFARYGVPMIEMSPEMSKSFSTIFSIVPKASVLGQPAIVADMYRRMTNVDSYYFSTESGKIINEQISQGTDPATAYLKSYLQYNMEAMTEEVGSVAEGLGIGLKISETGKNLINKIIQQSKEVGVVADDLISSFSKATNIPFDKAKAVISAFGSKTAKPFVNGLIYNDLSRSIAKNIGKAFNPKTYMMGGLAEFFEKAGINGMGWEYVEEFLSNRLSPLIEGTRDDFYDHPIDNQIEEFKQTTAALSPLLLLGASGAVINSGVDLYKYGADKISKYNSTLSSINGSSSELFNSLQDNIEQNLKDLKKSKKTDLYINAKENFEMRKRFEESPEKEKMTFQQYQTKVMEDADKIRNLVSKSLKENSLDVYETEKLKEEVTENGHKEQLQNLIDLKNKFDSLEKKDVKFSKFVRDNETDFKKITNELALFYANIGLPNFSKWADYIDNATITDSRRNILKNMYDDAHSFYEANKDKMSFVNSFELPETHVAGSLTNSNERIELRLVDGKYVFDKKFSKKDLISLLSRDVNLSNLSNIINISHVINNLKSPLNKNDFNAINQKISQQLVESLENIDLIDDGNLSSFNNIITILNKTDNVDVQSVREQVARILSNQSNSISSEEELDYNGKLLNTLLSNDKLFDYDFVNSLTNKIDFSFKKKDRMINDGTDFETGSIEDTIENMFANKSKGLKVDKQKLSELRKNESFNILEKKLNELEKSGDISIDTKKLLIKIMQYLPTDFISFEDIVFNNKSNASYYNTNNNTIYIANNSSQGTLIFEAVEEIVHSVYFNMLKEIAGVNASSLIKDSFIEEISGKTKSQLIKSIVGFYNSKNYSFDRFTELSNKRNLNDSEKQELLNVKQMLTEFKRLYKLTGKITEIDFVDSSTGTHYTTESLIKSFNRFNFFNNNKRGYDFKQSIYFASDMKEYFARTMSDFLLNKISKDKLGKGFKSVANDIKRWCYKKIVVPVAKVMMNDSIIDDYKDDLIDFLGGKISESDHSMIEDVFDEMNRNYQRNENPFTTELSDNGDVIANVGSQRKEIKFLKLDPEEYWNGVSAVIQSDLEKRIATREAIKIFLEQKGINYDLLSDQIDKAVINNDISFLSEVQNIISLLADEQGMNSQKINGYLDNPKGISDDIKKHRKILDYIKLAGTRVEDVNFLDFDEKKNFDKWFGDGNFFQDEDGNPIIKYHYGEFSRFKEWVFNPYLSDGGIHLGSFYSAVDRMNSKNRIGKPGANIIGFAVKMKSPLLMQDTGQFDESAIVNRLDEIKKGSFKQYADSLTKIQDAIKSLLPGVTGFEIESPNTANFKYSFYVNLDTYAELLPTQLRDMIIRVNSENKSKEVEENISLIKKFFSNDNLDYDREVVYSMLKENGYDGVVYINDYEGENSKDFINNFGVSEMNKTKLSLFVIDPKQVKSVKLNEGSFDESNNFAMSQRKELALSKEVYDNTIQSIIDPLKDAKNKTKTLKDVMFGTMVTDSLGKLTTEQMQLIKDGYINTALNSPKGDFLNRLTNPKELQFNDSDDTVAYSQRKTSSHNPTPLGTTTMSRDFYLALVALKGTDKINEKLINTFLDTVNNDKTNIADYRRVAKEGVELWARYYIQENAEKLGITKKSELARLSRLSNRQNIMDYAKDVEFLVKMVEDHGFRKLALDVKALQKIAFNKAMREFSKDVDFYKLLKELSSVDINLFSTTEELKEYKDNLKQKASAVNLTDFNDYVESVLKKAQDSFTPSKQKASVDENAVEIERQFKINQINFFKNHLINVYGNNKMITDFLNISLSNLSLKTINDYQEVVSLIVNRGNMTKRGVDLYLKIKTDQIMEDYKASMDVGQIKMLNSKVGRNAIRDYFSKLGNVSYFSLSDLVDFLDGKSSEYSGQLIKALIDPINTANKNHKKLYNKILEKANLIRKESFTEEEWNIIGIFGLLNQMPEYRVESHHLSEPNEDNSESLGGILYQQELTSIAAGTTLSHHDLNGTDSERDLAYRTFLALSNQNIKEGLMLRFGEVPDGYTQEQVDAAVREQSHVGKSNKSLIGKSELEKFKNRILETTGMSSIKELAEKMLSGEYQLNNKQQEAYEQIIKTFEDLHSGEYTDGVGVEFTAKNVSGLDFDTIHNYFPIMRINDFEKFDTNLLASIGGKEIDQKDNFYLMQTGFNLSHSFTKKRKQVAMSMNTNALELFRIRSEQQLFYILNEQHRQLLKKVFNDGFFNNSDSEHSLDSQTSDYLKRLFDNHFNRGISKGYIRAMNSAWTRNIMKTFGVFQVNAIAAIYKSPAQLSTIVNSMMGMKGSPVQKISALKFGISEVFGDITSKHKKWDDILIEHMPSVYFRATPDYNLIGVSGVNKKTTEIYKPKNTLDKINQKYNDLDNYKSVALYFVSLFDRISARVCAISAYKNYLDVNNIPFDYSNINEDAVKFAINQVNQTQASDDLINKPGVVQGVIPKGIGQEVLDTGLGYLLNKSFIAFQSFSINETRLLRKERASLIDSLLSGDSKTASKNTTNIAINIASRYVFQYIKRFCQVVVPLTAATLLTKGSGQDDDNDLGHRYFDGSNYPEKIDFGNVSMQIFLDMFSTVKPMSYAVSKASQYVESEAKERDLNDDEKLKYAFTDKIFANFYESSASDVAKTPVDIYKDYKGDHFMLEDAFKMFLQMGSLYAGSFDGGTIPFSADLFDLTKEIRKQHKADIQREIKTQDIQEDIKNK